MSLGFVYSLFRSQSSSWGWFCISFHFLWVCIIMDPMLYWHLSVLFCIISIVFTWYSIGFQIRISEHPLSECLFLSLASVDSCLRLLLTCLWIVTSSSLVYVGRIVFCKLDSRWARGLDKKTPRVLSTYSLYSGCFLSVSLHNICLHSTCSWAFPPLK